MKLELTPPESEESLASLKKYFREEFDLELGDLRARLVLDYVLQEFGPLAYNRGVQDAEKFLRARVEDLPNTCFEAPLPYWKAKKKR